MVKRISGACCALFLLACASCAIAGDLKTRSYEVAGHGELLLTVPDGWQDEIKPAENGVPPTIVFHPASGNAFKVMVTPIALPASKAPGLDKIRATVEQTKARTAPEAVEKDIVVHDLHGPEAAGYYFTATDKSPGSGPDDYPVMTSAEVLVGRVLLVTTAFYNDDSGKVRERAIAMLTSAKFKPADGAGSKERGSPQNGNEQDQSLQISKVPAGYRLNVPASRIEVILHGDNLEQQPGGSNSPRYFFFDDRGQGAVISGWFEPAQGFPGIKQFWENETRGSKNDKLPGPVNVKFGNLGKWQIVAYEIKFPAANVSNVHLRAERVQAGTWLDLHLSMTSNLSSAAARAKLEAVLESLEVREKAE